MMFFVSNFHPFKLKERRKYFLIKLYKHKNISMSLHTFKGIRFNGIIREKLEKNCAARINYENTKNKFVKFRFTKIFSVATELMWQIFKSFLELFYHLNKKAKVDI